MAELHCAEPFGATLLGPVQQPLGGPFDVVALIGNATTGDPYGNWLRDWRLI